MRNSLGCYGQAARYDAPEKGADITDNNYIIEKLKWWNFGIHCEPPMMAKDQIV